MPSTRPAAAPAHKHGLPLSALVLVPLPGLPLAVWLVLRNLP